MVHEDTRKDPDSSKIVANLALHQQQVGPTAPLKTTVSSPFIERSTNDPTRNVVSEYKTDVSMLLFDIWQ
jgi:hypothetical protein